MQVSSGIISASRRVIRNFFRFACSLCLRSAHVAGHCAHTKRRIRSSWPALVRLHDAQRPELAELYPTKRNSLKTGVLRLPVWLGNSARTTRVRPLQSARECGTASGWMSPELARNRRPCGLDGRPSRAATTDFARGPYGSNGSAANAVATDSARRCTASSRSQLDEAREGELANDLFRDLRQQLGLPTEKRA